MKKKMAPQPVVPTKKAVVHTEKKEKKIHLEDLYVTKQEVWGELIPITRGALKNWLTINKPKSESCGRQSALSDIVNLFNDLMVKKLKRGGE